MKTSPFAGIAVILRLPGEKMDGCSGIVQDVNADGDYIVLVNAPCGLVDLTFTGEQLIPKHHFWLTR